MSALAVDVAPLSTPCLQRRHSRCQLGEALCSCACHTPEGLKVERPKIEKCETLREACFTWMHAVEGAYKIADESAAMCEYMRRTAPDVWRAWLDKAAPVVIAGYIQNASRPARALSGRESASPQSVFGIAAEAFANGDRRAIDLLTVPYAIDAENTQSVLAELTYDDLKAPIDRYDKQARTNAMEAAYLRAVQKKLPKDNSKTVGDVFTNEQLQTLREAATQTK